MAEASVAEEKDSEEMEAAIGPAQPAAAPTTQIVWETFRNYYPEYTDIHEDWGARSYAFLPHLGLQRSSVNLPPDPSSRTVR